MDNIIDKIKKSNKYFWFVIINNKINLISQSKTKKDGTEQLKIKIAKKPDKYNNKIIIGIILKTKSKVGLFAKGNVYVEINKKQIQNNKLKKLDDNVLNTIYFNNKFLEENGFDYNYLKKIVQMVMSKIKVNPLGIYTYSQLLKLLK